MWRAMKRFVKFPLEDGGYVMVETDEPSWIRQNGLDYIFKNPLPLKYIRERHSKYPTYFSSC